MSLKKKKNKETYDIVSAIAYEKQQQRWNMRERQLYYQIKQKIQDINIEFFRWLKSYITNQSSRKSKVEVLKELGNIFTRIAKELEEDPKG